LVNWEPGGAEKERIGRVCRRMMSRNGVWGERERERTIRNRLIHPFHFQPKEIIPRFSTSPSPPKNIYNTPVLRNLQVKIDKATPPSPQIAQIAQPALPPFFQPLVCKDSSSNSGTLHMYVPTCSG